jgi:DNA-binding SARP family transcriptional activator/tetratricopeptide (TPR) repeat protein
MWVGVLGPLSIRCDGGPIAVKAARQRTVLAVLLVNANRVVPADELAETVWDGSPPPTARVTLRGYIRRLRSPLGPTVGARIVTRPSGYMAEFGDEELDLLHFAALYQRGESALRTGAWVQGSALLGEALGMWRGTPLSDIPCQRLQHDEGQHLGEMRLQAAEWWAAAELQLGRHEQLVLKLRKLVAEQPIRERFHAQLMTALSRCGRQAEALAAYRQARRILVDELGIEPGMELHALHTRILRGGLDQAVPGSGGAATVQPVIAAEQRQSQAKQSTDGPRAPATQEARNGSGRAQPARWVVPRQLPPAMPRFAGRSAALAILDKLKQEAAGSTGVMVISAIAGTAGVGKTALAVHWAHRVADDFPDGQLYLNLRGFDSVGPPVGHAQAIRGFLDALGVPPERIPADTEAQVGLYRSLLASLRILIVLDNAREAGQVKPLLAGGRGSMVMVTSRNDLAGLAVSAGAHLLALDVLTDAEAHELLARRWGPGRTEAETLAVEELISLCGRLPLALSIAAARAASHPNLPLSGIVSELRDACGPLDALDIGEPDGDVRAVFSWSYQNLTRTTARLFRLLGLHPGPDVTAVAAASLAGIPLAGARRGLAELTSAHLVQEHAPGRYTFHDLLHAYAAEQTRIQDPAPERKAATHRMLDYYLHTAYTADRLLHPKRDPITLTPPAIGTAAPGRFTGHAEAQAWFEAERRVLAAVIEKASASEFDAHAWRLAWTLAEFLNERACWQEWAAIQDMALTSARRLGDVAAEAHTERFLGQAYSQLGLRDAAHQHMRQALSRYEGAGDWIGQARIHLDIGHIYERQARYTEDLEHCQRALEMFRSARHRAGQARALNALGWCYSQLGDHQQALTYCKQALDLHGEGGDLIGAASTWDSLGYANHHLGHHAEAISCYQRAFELFCASGDRYYQGLILCHIGDAHHEAGQGEAAVGAWQQALGILDGMGHPDSEMVRGKLQVEHTRHRPEQ